jgi:hypothetical protein
MANPLGAFCNQLIRFFEELKDTYPEEKSIAMAHEAIVMAKRTNPKLVLDMFGEYIYVPCGDMIMNRKEDEIIAHAKKMLASQFNDLMVALVIFDKYWPGMTPSNRDAIWKYLQVLCILASKARGEA